MPITTDSEGRYSGEGWVNGGFKGPVWVTPSGWVWFPTEVVWRYMPFLLTGGPTWETWQAAGQPVFAPEPPGPPQTTPLAEATAPGVPSWGPSGGVAPEPAAVPNVGTGGQPTMWDGIGWVQDEGDDDWVYKDGTGRFWSDKRKEWAVRPDLLSGLPPSPGPVPMAVRAQAEAARLRTPWPSYREAWRTAKSNGWLCRRTVKGILLVMPLLVLSEYIWGRITHHTGYEPDGTVTPMNGLEKFLTFLNVAALVLLPICLWRVYHRALKAHDPHKAVAFAVATYGVVAGAAHAARRHGERHPSAPINTPGLNPPVGYTQPPNNGMRP